MKIVCVNNRKKYNTEMSISNGGAYGKCTDCSKVGEVDWDWGVCDGCAEKYAKEQEDMS